MSSAPTATISTDSFATDSFVYEVPIDPMDELHCESCQ
jgi:hypothetical protein